MVPATAGSPSVVDTEVSEDLSSSEGVRRVLRSMGTVAAIIVNADLKLVRREFMPWLNSVLAVCFWACCLTSLRARF